MTRQDLATRARALAESGERRLLGITGAPGAGKSVLGQQIVADLGPQLAVLVPMDGFHLAQAVLEMLGRSERKGAHHTFDAWGYLALLRRLREQRAGERRGEEEIVYAPEFKRELEEPVGSSIAVQPEVPLVVTEGNYLLLDEGPWRHVRGLVDEVWFLATPERRRIRQLTARHERFGRTPEEASRRSMGSDQRNAEAILPTSVRADLVVEVVDRGYPVS